MGEARVQKGQDRLLKLTKVRDTALGCTADVHSQLQAEEMAPLLKATAVTTHLTLTLTVTRTLTLTKTLKARTNLQMKEQIKEFTQVPGPCPTVRRAAEPNPKHWPIGYRTHAGADCGE